MVQLHLLGYEGPLDLLLELIEKRELDINEFSLVQVADQYMHELNNLEAHTGDRLPSALAEFLSIGSKLMLLKSKAMLPSDSEAFEPEEDVGRELVEMLEEYRRYRDAVSVLGSIDKSGLRSFRPAAAPAVDTPAPKGMPDDVTLELLTKLVRDALVRAAQQQRLHPEVKLKRDPVTVRDRIADLLGRLRAGGRVSFVTWIAEATTRLEVIVTFMAILELYKGRVIEMSQDDAYGDILVEARPGASLDDVEGEGFADEPSPVELTGAEPTADQPTADKPTTDEPTTDESAVDEEQHDEPTAPPSPAAIGQPDNQAVNQDSDAGS